MNHEEFGTADDYTKAIGAVIAEGVHEERLNCLRQHYASPLHTVTWADLATRVGYPNGATVSLQYGTFAKRVGRALGMNAKPEEGFWLYVVAGWADKRDPHSDHTQFVLRAPVIEAITRLGILGHPIVTRETGRVAVTTVYKRIESLKARKIALITQRMRERTKRVDGENLVHRDFRNREDHFMSQLQKMGIQVIPFSEPELPTRISEITKKHAFDMCVVSGEPFYQLLSIASTLRQARYSGPIYIEITEEEAEKRSSLQAAQANATRYKQEVLLHNLVYLTKSIPSGARRELPFDIVIPPPADPSSRAARRPSRKRTPHSEVAQSPTDIEKPPERFKAQVSRIIRDTARARKLKHLYEFRCQVCGTRIETSANTFYVEVHHVRPLGGSHGGLDTTSNMLVLCPNHHAMFDYRIPRFTSCDCIEIGGTSHHLTTKHHLSSDVVDYHNSLRTTPLPSLSLSTSGS